jgi:cytochrome c-type biogenesis protein CcmE
MRRRTAVLGAGAALVSGLGWVLTRGLNDDLVYYLTPSEIRSGPTGGDRVRLAGQVRPGSIERTGDEVRFVLRDSSAAVPVVLTGAAVPTTFREGDQAIVEGVYGADGTMRADTLLMKHDEQYGQER